MKIDLGPIKEAVGAALSDALGNVLEGAKADLQAFGVGIASEIVEAAAAGDAPRLAELQGQIRLVAEIQRLRAVNNAWNVVKAVVGAVSSTALSILGQLTKTGGVA